MSKSSGTSRYPWPRWVIKVRLANGNSVRHDEHLVSRATVCGYRGGPRHASVLVVDDEWYIEMKRRLGVLRAKMRADRAAVDSGTTRTEAISVVWVEGGVRG